MVFWLLVLRSRSWSRVVAPNPITVHCMFTGDNKVRWNVNSPVGVMRIMYSTIFKACPAYSFYPFLFSHDFPYSIARLSWSGNLLNFLIPMPEDFTQISTHRTHCSWQTLMDQCWTWTRGTLGLWTLEGCVHCDSFPLLDVERELKGKYFNHLQTYLALQTSAPEQPLA